MLKHLWESKGQTEGSSLEQMRELSKEAKSKFENRKEPRFSEGLTFLEEAVKCCEERAEEISGMTSLKELEKMLKEEGITDSKRYCGFVDMSNEIVEKIGSMKIELESTKKKE